MCAYQGARNVSFSENFGFSDVSRANRKKPVSRNGSCI